MKKLISIASIAVFLTACSPTAEQQADKQELVTRLALSGAQINQRTMGLLVPECLKNLEKQPVNEAAILAAGYKKKKALLGGPFYINLISPAGIGKYQNANIFSPNSNGGCSISVFYSSLSASSIKPIVHNILVGKGFEKISEDGSRLFSVGPDYRRADYDLKLAVVHSKDNYTSNVILRVSK